MGNKGAAMDQNFEDFKQKVKDSSDIVDVISGYVSLQKRGRSYWACCPFHGEKTPSFSVNRENQFFYCFGCHTGGDVFTFVEKMENVTFPEALRILAERARIPVPETHRTAADVRRAKAKEELYGVNELAGRYFAACLTKTQYGGKVQAYLQNRGITEDIIRRFSLGASLPGFSSLRHNLSKKGATDQQMLRAGLIREKDGRLLDAFIGRFMIPIKDSRGRIIAFGGRMLGDGVPKYINTGETEIFQKRETLFALDVALRAIRSAKEAIVVEGYMDAISLHAAGVDRVVASLGTAFSQEHAKLLSRIAEAVVFAYDAATRSFSCDDLFLVNAGRDALGEQYADFDKVRLVPYDEQPAVPADPQVVSWSGIIEGFGFGLFAINMPAADVDGHYINQDNMYYNVFIDGQQLVTPDGQTDIPYNYTDGQTIRVSGTSHTFQSYTDITDRIGVQVFYRVGDVVNSSNLVWYDIATEGIADAHAQQPVLRTDCYDALGRPVAPDTKGLVIRRTTFADGTVRTDKHVVR